MAVDPKKSDYRINKSILRANNPISSLKVFDECDVWTRQDRVNREQKEIHDTYLVFLTQLAERLLLPAHQPEHSRRAIATEIQGLITNVRKELEDELSTKE